MAVVCRWWNSISLSLSLSLSLSCSHNESLTDDLFVHISLMYRADGKQFNINHPKATATTIKTIIMELQYANDNSVNSCIEEDLQTIVSAFTKVYSRLSQKLNTSKTRSNLILHFQHHPSMQQGYFWRSRNIYPTLTAFYYTQPTLILKYITTEMLVWFSDNIGKECTMIYTSIWQIRSLFSKLLS